MKEADGAGGGGGEGGQTDPHPPPGKTTFKKPSLIRVNFSSLLVCSVFSMLVARLLVSFIYGVKKSSILEYPFLRFLASIYLFKVNNKNTRTHFKICSK